jgi:putative serine protease PepD
MTDTYWADVASPPLEPLDVPPPTSDSAGQDVPPPAPRRVKPPADGNRRTTALAAGVAAMVLAAGIGGGAVGAKLATHDATATSGSSGSTTSAATPGTTPLVNSGAGTSIDVAAVLAAAEGAVVDIQANGPRTQGQGSGVVYSKDGLVLTNAHVVSGATQVTVTTPSDRKARNASVVGTDTAKDIAVLRVSDTSGLVVAQLGKSADVKVGADVVAIGNALGLRGDPSVTRGIVSALDRTIGDLTGMLQTDAAINPGNSGGPLVNGAGQVIGINTAIAVEAGAQNIGFAIPIDTARTIADRLASGQPAAPIGYLGVSTADNDQGTSGATVRSVEQGRAAAAAGLRVGDVVVAVDGSPVSGAADFGRLIGDRAPGSSVKLTVLRGGTETTLSATLGTKP